MPQSVVIGLSIQTLSFKAQGYATAECWVPLTIPPEMGFM
jgi:hypothetical protein